MSLNIIVDRIRKIIPAMGQITGNESTLQSDGTKPAKWVPVLDQPVYSPRKIRVVCVGAGFSGLMLAHKYKYELKMDDYIDLTIYEKNADVGGTWLENRYPGVACDVRLVLHTKTEIRDNLHLAGSRSYLYISIRTQSGLELFLCGRSGDLGIHQTHHDEIPS